MESVIFELQRDRQKSKTSLKTQLDYFQPFPKARSNSMANLTIVATITSKADQVDLVRSELEKLIDVTRAEKGCVQYDLHQDNEDPTRFLFFENWESRELWQAHMGAQHLKDYIAATEGAIEEFTVNEMTKIA